MLGTSFVNRYNLSCFPLHLKASSQLLDLDCVVDWLFDWLTLGVKIRNTHVSNLKIVYMKWESPRNMVAWQLCYWLVLSSGTRGGVSVRCRIFSMNTIESLFHLPPASMCPYLHVSTSPRTWSRMMIGSVVCPAQPDHSIHSHLHH